jgi:hypothetical protein
MRNQCCSLFTCIIDYLHVLCMTHGVDLYTMYDLHGVYLHVLWTICMSKFSRYYAVIFHDFSFPMIDFLDNSADF